MTKKQMKNFAKEIARCEKIHQSKDSSDEDRALAEKTIMRIANQVMSERNGLELMGQIDDLVLSLLK